MSESKRLTSEERRELVAFLDGETTDELALSLEAKIANSASAKKEVDALRQTWELLDFLDMPVVDQAFTERTIEMLAHQDQRKERLGSNLFEWGKRAAVFVAWFAAIAGAFAAAWLVTAQAPDQNFQIVRDLPILERLDEYRAVEEVDFLRMLRDRHVLDEIGDQFSPDQEP